MNYDLVDTVGMVLTVNSEYTLTSYNMYANSSRQQHNLLVNTLAKRKRYIIIENWSLKHRNLYRNVLDYYIAVVDELYHIWLSLISISNTQYKVDTFYTDNA